MALKGDSPEAVMYVVSRMKAHLSFLARLFSITLGCLFGQMVAFFFAKKTIGVAVVNSIVLIVFFVFIVNSQNVVKATFGKFGNKINVAHSLKGESINGVRVHFWSCMHRRALSKKTLFLFLIQKTLFLVAID